MISRLVIVFQFFGIDRAISYTLLGRGWYIAVGPITVLLIARFLSPVEQGFYYTFDSLLRLQIFFELGLTYVIVQIASHEKAHLEWSKQGVLEGNPIAKARLASLVKTASIWYGVAGLIFVVVLWLLGWKFFDANRLDQETVNWQIPWIWLVLASGMTLFVDPLFAVLEGCGLVADVALMRVGRAVVGSSALALAIVSGWGLFAPALLTTAQFLWGLGWIALRERSFLLDLLKSLQTGGGINWWHEVWPFQWRIAVSWLSSYFSFQLFTPILFAFFGAAAAGRMGMSLSIAGMLSTLALAWIYTKAPTFGDLISKREFNELDRLFWRSLWQSVAVMLIGSGLFWFATLYLNLIHDPLSERLLEPLPLGLLVTTTIMGQVVAAGAIYLRAHKQEPLMWISVLNGGLIGLSTYLIGQWLGATGMMAGYFVVTLLVSLGGGTFTFITKRRLWHQDTIPCFQL